MYNQVKKIQYLLSPQQKKKLLILGCLLIVGMIFEMLGLGILIPALAVISSPDIGQQYPVLRPLLNFLGHPTRVHLIIGGMGLMVFIYLIKSLLYIYINWWQSKFTYGVSADLKSKLFQGYLRQPYPFHLKNNSALLYNNIQSEVSQFTTLTQSIIANIIEFSLLLGIVVLLIFAEPLGTLVVSAFLLGSLFIFHTFTKQKLLFWGKQKQTYSVLLSKHLLQGFGGVKDVKILGKEKYFVDEFNESNVAFSNIMMKTNTLNFAPRAYLELLAVTGLAGLITVMGLQGKSLALFIPTIGVFVAAAFRMLPSVNRIIIGMQSIRFLMPVLDMLYNEFAMINATAHSEEKSNGVMDAFSESINIQNLTYCYPDSVSPALNNISIKINKGESIGFVGPSGSGKSTMVDIILGLLTPSNGNIIVDGRDIQSSLRSWQDQIGYVPQTIYLTDDTLRRNIAFGIPDNEIDDASVERALNAAQLDEFVNNLPEGLETFVGERGVRLSGGQRQRIGIARALYHDPVILVLDEATSALDNATELGVMQAVVALQNDKTIIIIAHRLSTLKNCNRIYEINRGKIIKESSVV